MKVKLRLVCLLDCFREILVSFDKNNNGSLPTENNKYAYTHALIKNAQDYLSDNEKRNVTSASLISPSYLHANSFMYEPLIDVGLHDLIESARWLLSVATN